MKDDSVVRAARAVVRQTAADVREEAWVRLWAVQVHDAQDAGLPLGESLHYADAWMETDVGQRHLAIAVLRAQLDIAFAPLWRTVDRILAAVHRPWMGS